MLQSQFNAMVNADIQRLMVLPTFIVELNGFEVQVQAKDEYDAIDRAMEQVGFDVKTISCNDVYETL